MLSALIQAEAQPDPRPERQDAADGVALEIRAGERRAEVGIGEAVDHRVGFDVAIAEAEIPIPAFLERGAARRSASTIQPVSPPSKVPSAPVVELAARGY